MEYGKIISISGMGGLYEMVANKKDGAIVRSLDDKSTKFVPIRTHNVSQLEGIEVYTQRNNVSLAEVFIAMQNSSEPLPAEGDAKAVKVYFEMVYPDMDFERVYASDMKKMIKWFSVLKANDVEIKMSEEEENDEEINEEQQQNVEEKKAASEPEQPVVETKEVKATPPRKAKAAKPKQDENK